MRITDVVITEVQGTYIESPDQPRWGQVTPISLYPEFKPREGSSSGGTSTRKALYVEIQTDEGISGIFGPIQRAQAFIVDMSYSC